jgi:Tfp pilus assembly ATPase PilU
VVTQREVGVDVLTFADGLKYGLRQDPRANAANSASIIASGLI